MEISEKTRKALIIAVEGIKKMDIPDDKFDMKTFGPVANDGKKEFSNRTTCETPACFLGWMTLVKGLEPTEDCFSSGKLYIIKYSKVVLDIDSADYVWSYLFSNRWSDIYPTLEHAIQRAEYLINGGSLEHWNFDYSELVGK